MKKILPVFLFFALPAFMLSGDVLSLEESIGIGIENNLQIKMSKEEVIQAEMGKKEAFTSFYPRISSSFTYTRLDGSESISFQGMSFPITDANLYDISISLQHPLYTGGKIESAYAKARENVKMAGFERDTALQELVFEIKKGYFTILKAEKMLKTAVSLKKSAQEHLRVAETLFEEGTVTKIDVLKTEVFLNNTEQQILQAENMNALSRSSFNFLLNKSLPDNFEIEDVLLKQKDKRSLAYWIQEAYERRPEIKKMESASKIYGYDIDIERSNLKPQASFFFNYTVDRGSQQPVNQWNEGWNMGVAVEMDIWDWGEKKHRIESAKSRKKEIDQQYELQKKAIELEVKNSYLNLVSAGEKIGVMEKTREKAVENLRITNILYKEGMATNTDVLDAQADLTAAKNDYYQALYEYQVTYGKLEKSAGLTDMPCTEKMQGPPASK